MPRGKGRRSLSKYAFASDEETEYILDQLSQGKDVEGIAARVGQSVEEVESVRASFYPTTKLATAYLRSHALVLAKRIVADANVKEAVDLLERPAMGVVDVVPRGKAGDVNVGFFTSINPQSLGGVASGTTPRLAVPVPTLTNVIDMETPYGKLEPRASTSLALVGPQESEDLDQDQGDRVGLGTSEARREGRDAPHRAGRGTARRRRDVGRRTTKAKTKGKSRR